MCWGGRSCQASSSMKRPFSPASPSLDAASVLPKKGGTPRCSSAWLRRESRPFVSYLFLALKVSAGFVHARRGIYFPCPTGDGVSSNLEIHFVSCLSEASKIGKTAIFLRIRPAHSVSPSAVASYIYPPHAVPVNPFPRFGVGYVGADLEICAQEGQRSEN